MRIISNFFDLYDTYNVHEDNRNVYNRKKENFCVRVFPSGFELGDSTRIASSGCDYMIINHLVICDKVYPFLEGSKKDSRGFSESAFIWDLEDLKNFPANYSEYLKNIANPYQRERHESLWKFKEVPGLSKIIGTPVAVVNRVQIIENDINTIQIEGIKNPRLLDYKITQAQSEFFDAWNLFMKIDNYMATMNYVEPAPVTDEIKRDLAGFDNKSFKHRR